MIRYRITTFQTWKGQWTFIIRKSMRVTFKRSGRVGWRGLGFVRTGDANGEHFDTRLEALAAAQAAKHKLEGHFQ